jgi:hypothetical protein
LEDLPIQRVTPASIVIKRIAGFKAITLFKNAHAIPFFVTATVDTFVPAVFAAVPTVFFPFAAVFLLTSIVPVLSAAANLSFCHQLSFMSFASIFCNIIAFCFAALFAFTQKALSFNPAIIKPIVVIQNLPLELIACKPDDKFSIVRVSKLIILTIVSLSDIVRIKSWYAVVILFVAPSKPCINCTCCAAVAPAESCEIFTSSSVLSKSCIIAIKRDC